MPNRIVTAGKDGRGIIQIVKSGSIHSNFFYLGNKALKITARGQIKIPKSIMDKYGVTNDNGRKSLLLNIGATHDDSELIMGGTILKSKNKQFNKLLKTGKTGDRMPKRYIRSALESDYDLIEPSDAPDLYYG